MRFEFPSETLTKGLRSKRLTTYIIDKEWGAFLTGKNN